MIRFTSVLKFLGVGLVAAAIGACATDIKDRDVANDRIGSVASTTIHSTHTGHTYPIYIYLPASYASGTSIYPVIYATDGDSAFPPDGRFGNFRKILQRRGTDAILVAIGGSRWRSTDYTLPGAEAYHEFITQELIPYVESHLRANPKRRILSGLSLGGSFVVTSLFLEAPDTMFFSYYISAEGSFFQHSFLVQEQNFSETIGTKSIPVTLILARGTANNKVQQQQFSSAGGAKGVPAMANLAHAYDEATNSAVVDALYRRMVSRNYADLVLIETNFSADHGGTDDPSFDDAMARIFK